jgi:hypothetical protein
LLRSSRRNGRCGWLGGSDFWRGRFASHTGDIDDNRGAGIVALGFFVGELFVEGDFAVGAEEHLA